MSAAAHFTLDISNFQGVISESIPLSGFVSIQGETSCGKSSIRRALNALFFNEWESSFLNNKAKKAIISLTDNRSGANVTYERTDSSIFYKIRTSAGEYREFPKPGAGVPDEVAAVFGVSLLECDKESYNIHISRQQTVEPLFMIAYNEAQNTRILNRVFNVSKYEVATSLCNKDIRDNRSNIKLLESQTLDNNIELEQKRAEQVILGDKINQFQALLSKLELYDAFEQAHSVVTERRSAISGVVARIKQVQAVERKLEALLLIYTYALKRKYINGLGNDLVLTVKRLTDIDRFEFLSNRVALLDSFLGKNSIMRAMNTKLKQLLVRIKRFIDIDSFRTKLELLNAYLGRSQSLNQGKESLSKVGARLLEIKNELSSFNLCPLCNSSLEHNHFN